MTTEGTLDGRPWRMGGLRPRIGLISSRAALLGLVAAAIALLSSRPSWAQG